MNNTEFKSTGKKILFATFPGDGHFNPLTGLAVHLKQLGYDVRWYTSSYYLPRLKKMEIPHYGHKKALDVNAEKLKEIFPDREKHKSLVSKLNFDIINAFINRGPEYFEDIQDIYNEFPFDLMIADAAFTGIPFVKDLMQIPVIGIGIFPLTETSKDLPPAGLGMEPSHTMFGKIKEALLRSFTQQVLFRKSNKVLHSLFNKYKIPHNNEFVFDMLVKKSDLFLQSGTPGFEYARTDMSKHIKFIGPLLPFSNNKNSEPWFDERLTKYENIVLVTQGTVEKDIYKLLVPTLEAFKDSNTLVICTTGGSLTASLRKKYPQQNFIIEDFIPFNDVMPYTDVYITNGGYGGVMLGIENKIPLVVAGVHEGKNEICARVGYFKLGINLKTEKPMPSQIKAAVQKVLSDEQYKKNINTLAAEFAQYNPNKLFENNVRDILSKNNTNSFLQAGKQLSIN